MHSFPSLEPVCCSMSSSDCCFLTYMRISQEAGKVVWYSHLFKNFPQLVMTHTVKGSSMVNEAEVDVFLEFSYFSMIQWMLAIWPLVPLPFLNPACTHAHTVTSALFCSVEARHQVQPTRKGRRVSFFFLRGWPSRNLQSDLKTTALCIWPSYFAFLFSTSPAENGDKN